MEKSEKIWLILTAILIVIIVVSSLTLWAKSGRQDILIRENEENKTVGHIYIYGAVTRQGIYPLKQGDKIEDLIHASGGLLPGADQSWLKLYIPDSGSQDEPQKIDINRAEAWLLEALPDIGATRAEAIIRYRQQNGPFHSIDEITGVPGINASTFEKIKQLITVSD